MPAIDPSLMEAAGFVGAQAQQAVQSSQQRGAIQTNQLNQSGEQARRGISNQAEASGMLRSSMTSRDLGYQTSEQANKQQMIDLGISDTLAGANMDVMQALAKQQLQEQEQAQSRQLFDADMGLKWAKLGMEHPDMQIDWEHVKQLTGGAVSGPQSGGISNPYKNTQGN